MAGFLDIAVVLIIVISAVTCWIRGFIKTVFGVIGSIAAIIIALIVTHLTYEAFYDAFVSKHVVDAAYSVISEINAGEMVESYLSENGVTTELSADEINTVINRDGDLSRNISDYAKQKGEKDVDVKALMDKYLSEDTVDRIFESGELEEIGFKKETVRGMISDGGEDIKYTIKAAANPDKHKAAEEFEEHVLSRPAKKLTAMCMAVVIFVILQVAFMIVIRAAGVISRFEPIRSTDKLLGLVCGLISGTITVMCLTYAVYMAVTLAGGNSPIKVTDIESTYVFKFFYSFFEHL